MSTDNFFEENIVLENDIARLEPLEEKHFEHLLPLALDRSLWLYTINKINTEADFRTYFDTAVNERTQQLSYPFAIFDKAFNKYAGSTRYHTISFPNKRVEIGQTWIHSYFHGSGLNKACKFLLLSFGFDELHLNRIELKTNNLNKRSQKAMLKIGAVQEGILRRHIINDDGTIRDTVYFSFIAEEWNTIRNTVFKEF
ncbi:GNAT family N-acetyltransferase [Ferruginibacter albus]|uniref:GNAT family N-acetyltransferase n=1 Tax=Ferruginibacter albus TaxID=2875540 RepID=UPI001CC66AEB|nr:GNAT family protein [Ferruginibacter albus]UAY50728.1 GNAT family N-acetyltransferase [Ferruginibacter albus]